MLRGSADALMGVYAAHCPSLLWRPVRTHSPRSAMTCPGYCTHSMQYTVSTTHGTQYVVKVLHIRPRTYHMCCVVANMYLFCNASPPNAADVIHIECRTFELPRITREGMGGGGLVGGGGGI